MLSVFLLCLFLVSSKKAPLSLSEVLQKTKGQLDDLSSSIDGYTKALSSDLADASDSAQGAVKGETRQINTEIEDYKAALKEIIKQVDVEMHDYNRELAELESKQAKAIKKDVNDTAKIEAHYQRVMDHVSHNQASDIKSLGKSTTKVQGEEKKEIGKLMVKLEKVLAEMKKKEDAEAAKEAAKEKKEADEKAAAAAAAAAASTDAPADDSSASSGDDAAPASDDSAPASDDSAPAAADDSAPAASDDSAPAADSSSDASATDSSAPASVVAESLVGQEVESWVSSHMVLGLFVVLGAFLLSAFWKFQSKYSPIHSKKTDDFVFTSTYYQSTNGFKKQF